MHQKGQDCSGELTEPCPFLRSGDGRANGVQLDPPEEGGGNTDPSWSLFCVRPHPSLLFLFLFLVDSGPGP